MGLWASEQTTTWSVWMEWISLRPLWLLEHLCCEQSGLLWGKENGNHHGQKPMLPILGSHLVANLSSLPLSMTATEERASSLATYHLPTMSRCPCMPASLSSRRSLANLYHHHHQPKRHLPSGVNSCTLHYLMSTTSFMSSSSLMLSTTL